MPDDALSRTQVRAADHDAIERLGIPALVLMENAGRGAAEVLLRLGCSGPVVIACGKGNNGGDGLVIARHLLNAGVDVRVLFFARLDELSAAAAMHWHITERLPIPAQVFPDLDETRLATELAPAAWIVDALFGTGLTGPVRAPLDRVIGQINASAARVFAVDIPSGLNADTGEPMGATIRAQETVTFVAPKLGFSHAAEWVGRVHVVDIGIARRLLRA